MNNTVESGQNGNMNQDGKRPDTLNFALSRTADGTTAAVKTEHDASSEYAADTTGTNWRVDFGIQPRFNENNTEYVYSVEEAAASGDTLETRGYTRYVLTTPSGEGDKSSFTIKEGASSENNDYGLVTSETVSGVTEKTFHFLNRYTPLKDTLTVNKNWIDDGTFYTWTRPDSVYVDLCYSIDGGDRVNLYTAGNDDPVKKLLKQADANYAFRKEIKATDNWTGRLYNYKYRKSGAEYDTKSEYVYLRVTVPCDTTMVDKADGTPMGETGAVPMYLDFSDSRVREKAKIVYTKNGVSQEADWSGFLNDLPDCKSRSHSTTCTEF